LRLLRGGGRYIDDLTLPGMVHGAVVRSPHAHAKIRSIETEKAQSAPGVLAVLTGADWKASNIGDLPVPGGLSRRQNQPNYRPRYPALVDSRVRCVGDCVAFVVAETKNQVLDAAELVAVDYQPLPAIVGLEEAIGSTATRVWDDCDDNICFVLAVGDRAASDAAFARAHHVTRHRFVISRVTSATIETRSCIGDYNAADGRYTIYTGIQRAHGYRSELAQMLKLPESMVRVIAGDVGGSFGMKSAIFNEVPLVLLASKLVGRPVKWVGTRSESFVGDPHGRDNITDAELALDRDGLFLGARVKSIVNVGAYLQAVMPAYTGNLGTLAGVYRTPAMFAETTAVFTNTNPLRPYRGNGRPEAAYVIERLVDLAADETGIDPVELRRRNTIPPGAMPYQSALTFKYDCGEFEKNMDLALDLADSSGFERRRADSLRHGRLRGFGISNTVERAAAGGFEGAEIRFDRSGTVTLFTGAISQGQGHETVFKQLVCDRLGLDPNTVHYVQGDTDQVFFGEGSGSSRTATMGGSAFQAAVEKIIAKATLIAAHRIGVPVADVNFADGIFFSVQTNRTVAITDVARAAANPANLPKGMEAGLTATAIYSTTTENFPNGCHVCEVEIDIDTGQVELSRYCVVDDVGFVLNPMLLEGQIIGGISQGVGQILKEDIRFDRNGQLLTGSFMDYAMPRARDFCPIEIKSNPVPTKTNPLGVKGAGEAGCVGAMPAVANAIVDALSLVGIRHIDMPATPERVWRALRASSGGGAKNA
jgi:aerobic carbon-monoxide dehydrogenase large subunit